MKPVLTLPGAVTELPRLRPPQSSALGRVSACTWALVAWALALPSLADQLTLSASPGLPVPDGNTSGLVDSLNVPAGLGQVLDVNVQVSLAGTGFGGWNGDLYLYLAHEGVISVLANRPGLSASNPFGYGDNGLWDLTFDDQATGDFHRYQEILGVGDSDLPITGEWQPDARNSDPGSVLDTDSRNAFLSVFNGLEAGGEWRLYLADLSRGGTFALDRWSLSLTTTGFDGGEPIIPEPSTWAAMITLALGGALHLRARRRAA